jgi:uncharacterized membrane protein
MYLVLLIIHFLGLAMGVGTSFAMLTLGIASKNMEPAERGKFMMRASVLGKNGSIGFTLLILSGLGMGFMRGFGNVFAWGGGAFHAKLTLVVIMAGLIGYLQVLMKRARESGTPNPTIPKVGAALLVLGIGVVTCAVLAFK